MSIIEQVKELRAYSNVSLYTRENKAKELLRQAADTIESLSVKLQAANNNHSIKPNECVEVDEDGVYEGKCPCCGELVFNHFRFCPDCGQELLWEVEKYKNQEVLNAEWPGGL